MLEAARKYAQKGAQDRALREYEQLLKLDPRDAKLRLELGDAHRRWGQLDEAAAAYRRVAEQYTAEGFDARAVAVYKQIQSLDPKGYAACEPLAELYQRMGLVSEAVAALQAAADGHAREGNKRHALDLLRRMVGLDPSNTTNRIKVAELLRQEKLDEESAAEYEAACAELERQGETEAAGRVLERLLELAPDRQDVLVRLGRNLLARGRADEAEAPARRAVERDPREISHQELLADVYRAQGRDEKLVPVYRKIAELYRLRGDDEQARDIMQRFVPMAAFEVPAAAADESPFGSEALEIDDLAGGREPLHDDEFLDDGEPVTIAPSPAPVRPPMPRSEPLGAGRAAPVAAGASSTAAAEDAVLELGAEEGSRILGDPEALLAEASVYLRYGKRAQAIENLQAILARDPQHRDALEKLGDAYADDGDAAGAVAAWLRAGEIARDAGDRESMEVLRDRVAALDAAAAATLECDDAASDEEDAYIELPGEEDSAFGTLDPADPFDATSEDIEIDLEGVAADDELAHPFASDEAPRPPPPEPDAGGDVEEPFEIELDLDDAEPVAPPPSVAEPDAPESDGPASLDPEGVAADLEEAEFYLQQGLADEARTLFERVLAASPGHPLALVRLGELAAAAGEDPDSPGSEAVAPDRSATPVAAPSPAVLAEETRPDPDGAWLHGDDDPFVEAGGESAPLPDVDEAFDGDERVDRLDAAVPPAPAPQPHAVPSVSGAAGDFDLAAELSAALDEAVGEGARSGAAGDEGFREVFGAFKRGVEAALDSGDHEAHYDLGIAYREMGLLDDAIAEFRSAMQSATRRIDCLHMLGLCVLAQGRSEEAIDLLAHALGAPDVAQDQELAIRFELGRAYQQAGDVKKARSAWEKVASVDPDFCEVSELLASLFARSAPPGAELESFGDLIAEEERAAAEADSERESLDDRSGEGNADLDPEDGDSLPSSRRRGAGERPTAATKARRRKISFV